MEPWNAGSRSHLKDLRLPEMEDPSKQIRLLQCRIGKTDERIDWSDEVCSLDKPVSYMAISYTWGSPEPVQKRLLDGQSTKVHKSWFNALRQATRCYAPFYFSEPPKLWMDALCIDQSDLEEKAEQVQAKSKIFGQATRVSVSLGPASEESDILDREPRSLENHARHLRAARPDLELEAQMVDTGTAKADGFFFNEPEDWIVLMSQALCSGLSLPEQRLVTATSDYNTPSYATTDRLDDFDTKSNIESDIDITNAPSFWHNTSVNVDVTVR